MELIVIDNFLESSYHQHILHELDSCNVPWYYQNSISYPEDHPANRNDLGNFGFAIWLKKEEEWSNFPITTFIIPFCLKVKDATNTKSVIRARIDMTMFNPLGHMHQPHIDSNVPHIASVYYVNDSDGDTVIYNETYNGNEKEETKSLTIKEKISPKANRLLLFDGKYYHTGHSPSKHKNRIIINSNYGIA